MSVEIPTIIFDGQAVEWYERHGWPPTDVIIGAVSANYPLFKLENKFKIDDSHFGFEIRKLFKNKYVRICCKVHEIIEFDRLFLKVTHIHLEEISNKK
ncbi:MAG: hypothetical protein ABI342_09805 [Nitrososphaera sp.]|jgi:hypothetical protein